MEEYFGGKLGALGNPTSRYRSERGTWWDTIRVVVDYEYAGQYILTDKIGYALNWQDVKDGMIVKIQATKVNYRLHHYLQPVSSGSILVEFVISRVLILYIQL